MCRSRMIIKVDLPDVWSNPDLLVKVQNNVIKMGDYKTENIKTLLYTGHSNNMASHYFV